MPGVKLRDGETFDEAYRRFKKQADINSTIICGNCKGVNESSNTFCKHCGKPLYNECPKCHYLNDNSATYCTKCGEKLEK